MNIETFKRTVVGAELSALPVSRNEFNAIKAQMVALPPQDRQDAAAWMSRTFPGLMPALCSDLGYESYTGKKPVIYDRSAPIVPVVKQILDRLEDNDLPTPLDLRAGHAHGLSADGVSQLFAQLSQAERLTFAREVIFNAASPLSFHTTEDGAWELGAQLATSGADVHEMQRWIDTLGESKAARVLARALGAGYAGILPDEPPQVPTMSAAASL